MALEEGLPEGLRELRCQEVTKKHRAGVLAQSGECLLSTHETLGLLPSTTQEHNFYTCNISTGDVDTGGPEVQDCSWLYIKLECSLRACLKKQKPAFLPQKTKPNQTKAKPSTGYRGVCFLCRGQLVPGILLGTKLSKNTLEGPKREDEVQL